MTDATPAPAADPAAATPPAAPAATPPAAPQTAEAADWRSQLPDDLKVDPVIKRFDSVTTLAQSYKTLNSKLGGSNSVTLVPVPQPDAPAEAWDKYYASVRPATAADYKFSYTPKEAELDNEFVEGFKKTAFNLGLAPKQADELFTSLAEQEETTLTQEKREAEEARLKAEAALKKEWGAAYEERINGIKPLVKNVLSDDDLAFFDEAGVGNDPRLLKILDKFARQLGEDATPATPSKASALLTPGEAQAEIRRNQADPAFKEAWLKSTHPNHAWAVAEMKRLHTLAAGKKA